MSQKPVAQKLLIKAGYKVLLLNEPKGYRSILGRIPENVALSTEPFDLVQVFVTSKKDIEDQLNKLKPILKPKGLLWVTYPKGTSKVKTDINRDVIRDFAQTVGLQAVAMVSIDETWAALRLKIT